MYKRMFLFPAVLASLSLVACTTGTGSDTDDTVLENGEVQNSLGDGPYLEQESSESDTAELDLSSAESAQPLTQTEVESVDPATGIKTIRISATDWEFSPATIMAKRGENVRLVITADDGTHGFAVPALSINARVEEGQTVTVDLPTDQAGTFDAFCSVPCGEGHADMKATIIIQES